MIKIFSFKILPTLILFAGLTAQAQSASQGGYGSQPQSQSQVSVRPTAPGEISGLRVSLFTFQPKLDAVYKGKTESLSDSSTTISPGVGIGYISTPGSGFGFEGRASIAELKVGSSNSQVSEDILRAEMNANIAFSKIIIGKAGLNVAQFIGSYAAGSYRANIGGQFGIDLQFTSKIAGQLQYSLSQFTNKNDSDYVLRSSGFEIGMSAIF